MTDKVDFVLAPVLENYQQTLRVHQLAKLPVVVGMSVRHVLASQSVIELEDLKKEVFIEFTNSEGEAFDVVKSLIGLNPQAARFGFHLSADEMEMILYLTSSRRS